MVGLHPVCCCEGEDTCPLGTCCSWDGSYSGEGCPDLYNVNITVSEMVFICHEEGGCEDWVIPSMEFDFEIPNPCGGCPGTPFGEWCGTQLEYLCNGTGANPCVPSPTCKCPSDSPHGYNAPDAIIDQSISFQYRRGSEWWLPVEGRVRMEFLIGLSYGYGGYQWLLKMDKPAPNCIDWTVEDGSIYIHACNNCPVGYFQNDCPDCNPANPSDPNYFGCCYQCAGPDCCDGCTIDTGMIIPNNWGRCVPCDGVPILPKTWSTPAILGFTVS